MQMELGNNLLYLTSKSFVVKLNKLLVNQVQMSKWWTEKKCFFRASFAITHNQDTGHSCLLNAFVYEIESSFFRNTKKSYNDSGFKFQTFPTVSYFACPSFIAMVIKDIPVSQI